jgi:hypothetical protein
MCRSSCVGDGDCEGGYFCISGSCSKKPNGGICGSAGECMSMICGGRCCTSVCTCTQPSAGNKVVNAGFDQTAQLSGWTKHTPTGTSITWVSMDAESCPYSGSAKIVFDSTQGATNQATLTQCVAVTGGDYNFSFRGQSDSNAAFCQVDWYSGAGCTGTVLQAGNPFVDGQWDSWTDSSSTNPGAATSALITCTGAPPIGGTVSTAYIDMVYFSAAPTHY